MAKKKAKKTVKSKISVKTASPSQSSIPKASLRDVFFGDQISFSGMNFLELIKDSWLGFVIALILGWGATKIAALPSLKWLDVLVLAIVLGMVVRLIIGRFDTALYKVLPGVLLAQIVLIPIGIILYGKNLNLKLVVSTHPTILIQLIVITALTYVIVYWLAKMFKLDEKMAYLLGFGSAVCGASAIAITSPVVEGEPDDTSAALVTNTILVIISLLILSKVVVAWLNPMEYANAAGALLQQTGFVKTALAGAAKNVAAFGMAIKSLRVALLVIAIPAVSYILRKRIFIPWYLLAFIGFGTWYTYGTISANAAVVAAVGKYGTLSFASALAAVGMNADITKVIKKIWAPLAVTVIAFVIGIAVFMLTNMFVAY